MDKVRVVSVGGGNGSGIVLAGLKSYSDKLDISAVISISDSGGSSGRLRQEFGVLPPGDILRAVVSLTKYDSKILKQIFYRNRFSGCGKLDQHNLGNIFLVLAENYSGDFLASVRALEQAVEAAGHVYPASLQPSDLCAELSNGQIIKTEAALDKPDYNRDWRIKKVWLEPNVQASDQAQQVLSAADYILLGPGSLYTSVIASLLPSGIKDSIARSTAKLVFVSGNAYTSDGETGPVVLSESIEELEQYLPRSLDRVIFNDCELNKQQQAKYAKKQWNLILDDGHDDRILRADYESDIGGLCSFKLGKILMKKVIVA